MSEFMISSQKAKFIDVPAASSAQENEGVTETQLF